jgi:hypothetical protein
MKRIQVKMLRSYDQLQARQFYNLPENIANDLLDRGYAALPDPWPVRETKPVGPSEIKPVEPSETKVVVKKKLSARGRTEKES